MSVGTGSQFKPRPKKKISFAAETKFDSSSPRKNKLEQDGRPMSSVSLVSSAISRLSEAASRKEEIDTISHLKESHIFEMNGDGEELEESQACDTETNDE